MPTTAVYALPYQAVTDAPNGPVLGQALADAVEAQIVRLDTRRNPVVVSGGLSVTTTETTFLTAAWTVVSGDVLRVKVDGQWTSNGNDRQLTVRLKEDGVTIRTLKVGGPTANLNWPFFIERTRSGLSVAAHTYTVTGQLDFFTGSITEGELSVSLAATK